MRVRRKNYLVPVFLLLWALLLGGALLFFTSETGNAAGSGVGAGQRLAQKCLVEVFPTISRGSSPRAALSSAADADEQANASAAESQGTLTAGITEEYQSRTVRTLCGMVDKAFPFLGGLQEGAGSGSADTVGGASDGGGTELSGSLTGSGLGVSPAALSADGKAASGSSILENADKAGGDQGSVPVLDTEESKKPTVLIVHTHATESYQPVNEGNFHSTSEEGTVRDVGNQLTNALEAKGIHVIHDKTLHDHPSYNASYGRSLETVKNYLEKNPSIKIVIDLHRDAASYTGNAGKVTTVNGEKVATYSLVVGKGNANLQQLMQFANRIIEQSNKLYPGMAGRIIEKEYRFNEYVSDQYMLLEVGNNENTIEQVRRTGVYFADVIAAYLKEYGQ